MKKRRVHYSTPIIAFLVLLMFAGALKAQQQNVSTTQSKNAQLTKTIPSGMVNASETGAPIHPYYYGMFTELLFNLFEKGLWSEMISDRKFFYPINTLDTLIPGNTKRNFNRWRPIGPEAFITMDKKKAYTGKNSPVVQLHASVPHGMQQAGMAFVKGKSYTGRIVLAGDSGATVTVSMVWGPGAGDRQSVSLSSLTADYVKYPLTFIAGGDSGRIEITGTGNGSFHVGAVSLMPADNVQGFRRDLVDLLRELKSGIYRWPGGNMVANYDWRDGIGDIDKRAPRYEYAWKTVEYNDVGTDEFLTLCKLLDVDPYMCVNAGFGDAYSAAQWVEYCNGSKETPMGAKRAANGHPEPYNIKLWGIGNEMYGQWQLGHMDIKSYTIKHNMFGEAMRAVDSTIKLVASGATPFETSMTARHHRKPLPSKLPYDYGSPEDWSGNLLANSSGYIDYLAEHIYPETDKAFNVDSQKLVPGNDSLQDRVRRLPNRIQAMAEAYSEYMKRMPELGSKNIKYALDEWIGEGAGMEPALGAAEGLHEMFRHSDIIYLGNYTAATLTVVYNQTAAAYSTIGLVFKMYKDHFGTIPVKVSGDSPQHDVAGTVGVDKASISSGSDTYPLDVMAAFSEDRKKLSVAIINPTEAPQSLNLSFNNMQFARQVNSWHIVPPTLKSQNEPGETPVVNIVANQLKNVHKIFNCAPASVSIYEFFIK